MNKTYRSVWNEVTGTWVAVQENARGRGKRGSSSKLIGSAVTTTIALSALGAASGSAEANVISASGACSGQPTGYTLNGAVYNANTAPTDNSTGGYNPIALVAGCNASVWAGATGGTAYGAYTTVTGVNGVAVGLGAMAYSNGTAIGTQATASGPNGVAIGMKSFASAGGGATAVGYFATAQGMNSAAFGLNAVANGTDSIALGNGATAYSQGAVALGAGASTNADNAVVVGHVATAKNVNDVALGGYSTTSGIWDTSLGITVQGKYYSFAGTNTAAGTVSVGFQGGERQIQYVAAGLISSTSTDAINGSQLYGVAQAINNINIATGGAVKYDTYAGGTVNYNSITLGGNTYNNSTHTGGTKITNVADGTNPSDAVNYSQLTNVSSQINNIYNSGTKYFHANSTGTDSQAVGQDSVAIGMGAVANNANDVALGAGSTTSAAVGTSGATIGGKSYTFAGANPSSTVSVGSAGNERTITNVAAGRLSSTSTDAVNGSQLYATDSSMNDLWNTIRARPELT